MAEATPTDVTADTTGQTIHVVSPSGKTLHEIPLEGLEDAKAKGYKVADPSLVKDVVGEADLKDKYEGVGSQIETGLEGAGEGLTFGLSPIAERALGVKEEDIQQRAARNPLSHATGTVAGGIANAALTAGAGTALGVGAGATDVLSTALQLGNVGSKVAKAALTGAALNAAYEAGNQINKAVLGAPETTAAHAIGQIGLSGLLGAGIGATFGLGEAMVSPVLERISDKLAGAADKADAAIQGLQNGETEINQASRNFVKADQEAFDHTADLFQKSNEARTEEMHNLTGTMPLQDARAAANDYVEQAQAKLNDINDNSRIYRNKNLRGAVGDELDAFKAQLNETNSSPEIQNALNKHKQILDKILQTGNVASGKDKVTVDALQGIRGLAKDALEDEAWGPAGERQAAYNASATKYYDASAKYLELMGNKEGDISPVKARQYMTWKAAGDVRADAIDSARADLQEAREGVLTQAKETFKNTSNVPLDKEALENLFSKNKDMHDLSNKAMGYGLDAAKAIGAARDVTKGGMGIVEKLSRKALETAGGIAGGALGGSLLPGAGHIIGYEGGKGLGNTVADAVFSGLGSQSLVQQQTMARLLRMSEDGTKAIQNGVAQFFSGRSAAIGTQALKALNVTVPTASTRGQEPINKTIASVRDITPDAIVNHMSAKTAGITPVAPEVAMHMGQQVGSAIMYAKQFLPPVPDEGLLLKTPQAVSPSQKQNFTDVWGILDKPQSALKHMANGTLTSKMVDALKTVYPPIHEQIGDEIITQLAKNPDRKLSIQQQQQLSTFLGQPVRGTYGPDFAQWAQANAVGAPPSQPTPKTSGKQLSIGEQSFTNFEKQQSNKES